MKISGTAKQITVYISDADRLGDQPLADAIVERALAFGLDGATVLHGIEGFGAHHEIHVPRIRRFQRGEAGHLPVVVIVIARSDRAEAFLTVLEEMLGDGVVTIQDVQMRQLREEPD